MDWFKRRKKIGTDETAEKQPQKAAKKEVAPPETQNLKGLFKGRARRVAINLLVERYDDIGHMADPAKQLLEYKRLADDGVTVAEQISGSGLRGVSTTLSGVALGTLAVTSVINPLFIIPAILVAAGGVGRMTTGSGDGKKKWTLSSALAKDSKTLVDVLQKTQAEMDRLVTTTPLVRIAESPYFDEVTVTFPGLKDRFLAAAAKDKLLQDVRKPQKPKPQPDFDQDDGPAF